MERIGIQNDGWQAVVPRFFAEFFVAQLLLNHFLIRLIRAIRG
jgi:hypothetical protein